MFNFRNLFDFKSKWKTEWALMMTGYEFHPPGGTEKRKTHSTGKLELKAAHPRRITGPEDEVGCVWHTPDSWTKQATWALLRVPTSDSLSLHKLRAGGSMYILYRSASWLLHWEVILSWSRIYSLLKALGTRRHMWKELSVPGRQGTKSLLLELGQSSLSWKPLSSFGFG